MTHCRSNLATKLAGDKVNERWEDDRCQIGRYLGRLHMYVGTQGNLGRYVFRRGCFTEFAEEVAKGDNRTPYLPHTYV